MKGLNAKAADLSTTVAEVRNRRDKLREKLGMEIPSADSRPVATPGKVSCLYSQPLSVSTFPCLFLQHVLLVSCFFVFFRKAKKGANNFNLICIQNLKCCNGFNEV